MAKFKSQAQWDSQYNFNPLFGELQCYALGLLWADGWLYTNKKCRARYLGLDVLYDDFSDFKLPLQTLGNVCNRPRQRKNRKLQMVSKISNKSLCEWLFNIGFADKSTTGPTRLLEHIPSCHLKDFIRGWVDGDGCFYVNIKNSASQFIIAGPYDQDWSCFTQILDSIDIKRYKIVQKVQTQNGTENKGSIVRITNRKDIRKLFDYLYIDATCFLRRKFDKCNQIVQIPDRDYKTKDPFRNQIPISH